MLTFSEAFMHGNSKHDLSRTTEYHIWNAMMQRCNNRNHKQYDDYGGRGVTVSPEWHDFLVFLADMGCRPEKHLTLERRDNDKGYSKENCSWQPRAVQNYNQRIRRNNTSGIAGVAPQKGLWFAYFQTEGMRKRLYNGPDFFEACCARKSYENRRKL